MGKSWINNVKGRGNLTFRTVNEDTWGPAKAAFNDAISEFNSTSKKKGLCVRFVKSSQSDESVDIQVETFDSLTISATYQGVTQSETFPAIGLRGRTFLFSRDGNLEKAFTFFPRSPPISTPSGVRPAGKGVLKVIVFHELLHAVGLENSDHAPDDVFQEQPRPYPGTTPSEDGIMIGSTATHMPPIILSKATIQRVKDLWCTSGRKITATVHYKMQEARSQSV